MLTMTIPKQRLEVMPVRGSNYLGYVLHIQ